MKPRRRGGGPCTGAARITLLLACVIGLAVGHAGAQAVQLLRVVATTTQVADFARNVGGRLVRVDAILSANVDPRTYTLGPGDLQNIALAGVILENGVGLEDAWVGPLRQGDRPGVPVVLTNRGVRWLRSDPRVGYAITAEGLPVEIAHPAAGWHPGNAWSTVITVPVVAASRGVALLPGGPDEPLGDPFVWSSVPNVVRMVANIRDALAAADPPYAQYFQANAARYITVLDALDGYIVRRIETIPPSRRTLVTTSDAFGYYARRYGLRLVHLSAMGSPGAPQHSASRMATIAAMVRAAHVNAIFVGWSADAAAFQMIAHDAGVRVVTGLYGASLGLPGSDGDTYVKMMRHDTDVIVGALR